MRDSDKERIDNFLQIYKDRYAGDNDTPTGLISALGWLQAMYDLAIPTAYEYLNQQVTLIHIDYKSKQFDDEFAKQIMMGDWGMTKREEVDERERIRQEQAKSGAHAQGQMIRLGLSQMGIDYLKNHSIHDKHYDLIQAHQSGLNRQSSATKSTDGFLNQAKQLLGINNK